MPDNPTVFTDPVVPANTADPLVSSDVTDPADTTDPANAVFTTDVPELADDTGPAGNVLDLSDGSANQPAPTPLSLDLPPLPAAPHAPVTPGLNWPMAPAMSPSTQPAGQTPSTPPAAPQPPASAPASQQGPMFEVYSPPQSSYGQASFAPSPSSPSQQYDPYRSQPVVYPPAPYPMNAADPRPMDSSSTTWAAAAHWTGILLGFLGPLIVYAAKGSVDPYVRKHAAEALNFQLTLIIGYIVSAILVVALVGLALMPLLWVLSLVFSVQGAAAASRGASYRYPINIRMVK